MTSRKFLALTFRLSIVAGVGFGLFDAYRTFSDWNDEKTDYARGKIRMECAAEISDEWLTRNTNKFGTVDVSPMCGPGSDGKTFFTNANEIGETRRGENTYPKQLWRKPFDLVKSMIVATAAFVGTNLIGALILGFLLVGRWIAFGGRCASK